MRAPGLGLPLTKALVDLHKGSIDDRQRARQGHAHHRHLPARRCRQELLEAV